MNFSSKQPKTRKKAISGYKGYKHAGAEDVRRRKMYLLRRV